MQTEAIFNHIAARLKSELLQAQRSIYIAVAWFTHRGLFDILLDKAQQGVAVHLLVSNDHINANSSLPFDKLNQGQSSALLVGDGEYDLMHNKFCVIDENIVITGSYNWSYNAENNNHENIVIITGDKLLAAQYIEQFNYIVQLQEAEQQSETTFSRIGVTCYLANKALQPDCYTYTPFGNDIGFFKPYGFDKPIKPLPANATEAQKAFHNSSRFQREYYQMMLDIANAMLADNIDKIVVTKHDIDAKTYPLVARYFDKLLSDKVALLFRNNMLRYEANADDNSMDLLGF